LVVFATLKAEALYYERTLWLYDSSCLHPSGQNRRKSSL